MIRRVYLDFIRRRLAQGNIPWLLSRGKQYALIHASYLLKRPLCGPALGTLVTNYTCNYGCTMCDLKLRDRELRDKGLQELDTRGMKRVLEAFAGLGVSGVGFTGGEPLLRKDIFELLAHTKDLGMISHLNTNGFFVNDENARRIAAAGVDSVNISLDGSRADTHDGIRGVPGAFERVLKAVGRINTARKRDGVRLRLKTVTVLQERNIDEVADLVALAGDLGVDCVEFIPRQPFTTGEDRRAESDLFLGKVDKVVDYLLGPGKKAVPIENSPSHVRLFRTAFSGQSSPLRCYAGYNSLAVDCYGEIYPCVPWYNWRHAAGNLRDHDLAGFWYSKEYDGVRREIRSCRKCTLNCQAELNLLFDGARPFRA
jgi:MoaA/NifB/PqqE/SkfB family radical SAM enzyme